MKTLSSVIGAGRPARTVISVVLLLLGVTIGYAGPTGAAPFYVAKFEAVLDSGFGGLPPTLLQVSYVFEDRPPYLVVPHEAYYEFESISVRLNGVAYSATPLEIGVQNNLRDSGDIRRDAYFVVGTVSGTYGENFELMSAGLEFVKYGSPPDALSDLSLPRSVADLGGFTVESELDYRVAFLAFENLATGGLFSSSAPLMSLSIERVAEPGTFWLLGLGLAGLGVSRRRYK